MSLPDAARLYESAREDLSNGFTARAQVRLRQAAEAGHAPAQLDLARNLLDGPSASLREAGRAWLNRAAEAEFPPALYARSALRYAGRWGAAEPDAALQDLNAAAAIGYSLAEAALAVAWQEHPGPEARAAADAWLLRAMSHRSKRARALHALAGLRHNQDAANVSAPPSLPAWGTSPTPDFRALHREPDIHTADEALSPWECAWVRMAAYAGLRPSRILDPTSGLPRADPVRTGMTTYFSSARLDIVTTRLVERFAAWAGCPPDHSEPLAVLRYRPGEEYKPHRDGLGPGPLASDPFRASGDRRQTVLGYLNTPAGGGGTQFPQLDLCIGPRLGRVLIFSNLDGRGLPLPTTLHAGLPVTRGSKWLASLWLREHPVNFV